jgi:predicted RNA binding protein YcfA (HicA-like mRNA interferase family)
MSMNKIADLLISVLSIIKQLVINFWQWSSMRVSGPVAFYKEKNGRKCTVWTKSKTCVMSTLLK